MSVRLSVYLSVYLYIYLSRSVRPFVCLSLSLSFADELLGVNHEVIGEIDHKISRLHGEYLASFAYPEWFTFSLYVFDEHGNIIEKYSSLYMDLQRNPLVFFTIDNIMAFMWMRVSG